VLDCRRQIRVAPAVQQHPEARTTKELDFMAETRIPRKHYRDETRRTILRESTQRFNNELLDDEERQLLLDRIKRLRKALS
jgi:hypothetical protein